MNTLIMIASITFFLCVEDTRTYTSINLSLISAALNTHTLIVSAYNI